MTASDKPLAGTPRSDERLAKRVAAMLACSRREAEHYIQGGWVRVEGEVVEEPQFRVLRQTIEIDKAASLIGELTATLLLHKPAGCDAGAAALKLLGATSHVAHDACATRPLKRHFVDLSSPLSLETGASGLLVFTQDWRIARKLTEDASLIEHEFTVDVEGPVSTDTLMRLNQGLSANAQPLPRVRVSINSSSDSACKLRFALKGSHPGLLAYLCQRVSLKILAMKRIRVGRVAMGHLPVGQWRYLQTHERF